MSEEKPAKKTTKVPVFNQLDEEECLSYFIVNRKSRKVKSEDIQKEWLKERDSFFEKGTALSELLYKERLEFLVRVNRTQLEYSQESIHTAINKAMEGL